MEEHVADLSVPGVTPDVDCHVFTSGEGWREERVNLPQEMALTIFINGLETVTILCTPTKLNQLVLGFLYMEEVISGLKDVATVRVCEAEPIADVHLTRTDYTPPPRRTLVSGCGSAVGFKMPEHKLESTLKVTPDEVLALMKLLYQQQSLFRLSGGLHSSALCDRQQALVVAEDIGRHNTLDKIMGECLLRKLPTQDSILLATGRITSEMLFKAARMQAPIVVSRGTPTDRAITLGRDLGITVIGYARGNRLSVFSNPERVRTA